MTQALQLPEGPNGPMLRRGPAYQGFVAVAARLVELVFNDALINERPGGLMVDHMLAGMSGLVPELPVETHLEIIQTFVHRRHEEMVTGYSGPVRVIDATNTTTRRIIDAMLALNPDDQRYIMVNFLALRDNEPLIGRIHPMARFLLKQSEQTIKAVVDAMFAQAKAAKNPAL